MFLSREIDTSANSSAVYWSRVSRDNDTAMLLAEVIVTSYPSVQTIYTIWYNFDTVLYQFLKTWTTDRCLICIVQNLRFSGFSLYPLLFFLYSPFKSVSSRYKSYNALTYDLLYIYLFFSGGRRPSSPPLKPPLEFLTIILVLEQSFK